MGYTNSATGQRQTVVDVAPVTSIRPASPVSGVHAEYGGGGLHDEQRPYGISATDLLDGTRRDVTYPSPAAAIRYGHLGQHERKILARLMQVLEIADLSSLPADMRAAATDALRALSPTDCPERAACADLWVA